MKIRAVQSFFFLMSFVRHGLSLLQPESLSRVVAKPELQWGVPGSGSMGCSWAYVTWARGASSQWQQIHSQRPTAPSHTVQAEGTVKLGVWQKSKWICRSRWALLQVLGMSGLGYALQDTPKDWPLSWWPEVSHQDATLSLSTQKQC